MISEHWKEPKNLTRGGTAVRFALWLALILCLLLDNAIGLPLILGMDFHFGSLGFITLVSLWSPLGLTVAGGFVAVQIVVIAQIVRLKNG